MLVWIPELFSRYYNYKKRNLDEANLCTASEWLLRHHNKAAEKTVSSEAYVAALIVALTTIPLIVLTGIAVKYFNKKILLCTYRYRMFKYTHNSRNLMLRVLISPVSDLQYKFFKLQKKTFHTNDTRFKQKYLSLIIYSLLLDLFHGHRMLQKTDTW